MFGFGKKVQSSDDEREILAAAKGLLKNGTLPQPSIRGAISQAMQDLGYGGAKIGQSGEVSLTGVLRRYGEIPTDTPEGVESWGKGADGDAIQKAFTTTIECLKK